MADRPEVAVLPAAVDRLSRPITPLSLLTILKSTDEATPKQRVGPARLSKHLVKTRALRTLLTSLGYEVASHAPQSQTLHSLSGHATPTRGFGGRGRNRGASHTSGTSRESFQPRSGSSTPVSGLGFRGKGHSFRSGLGLDAIPRGANKPIGATVGKSGITWGGGAAPLFVKAGELFKDGEVDVVTVDKGKSSRHSRATLADPRTSHSRRCGTSVRSLRSPNGQSGGQYGSRHLSSGART